MPYDLYGQYYASAREAENAEMAQCAEINLRHQQKEINSLKNYVNNNYQNDQGIWQYIQMLEERISVLEKMIKP